MVRHVFFSFHYERDHWRANVVRQSWVTQERDAAGYVDAAEWETIKRQNDEAIERWIDDQLHGTSVTVVLIGSKTYGRKWVDYEIEESVHRGNGIVGVRVHNIEDKEERVDTKGRNPLSNWHIEDSGDRLDRIYDTYDWKCDDGYKNFGDWVEEAKAIADRRF